jgi:hypothetical protein
VFLQYPHGVVPDELVAPIHAAAAEGGASLFVNGIDPGFANDWLPLVLPVQPQPFDVVNQLIFVAALAAFYVRVFNSQDIRALLLAGKKPVEEGGAGVADVNLSGGGGGEAYANLAGG